jgi:hypothetical protein
MKLVDKVNISPDAIARRVGDELVILNVGSGTYFGLDPVGARIWELLQEGKSPQQVCDVMIDEYEVSQEVLERDITKLMKDLLAEDLISLS